MAANKQDSNLSGLRYAKESSLRTLPGTPNWIQLEPNGYNGFGAQYSQVARNPINALRQRKKGALVGVDAGGGFGQDLTLVNSFDIMQGFFFAAAREKTTTAPLNGTAIAISNVTSTTYAAAGGLTFDISKANLVKGSGFNNAANNGLKLITLASATTLTTTGNVAETPPATAKVEAVGFQFGSAAAALAMNGNLLRLQATGIETIGGLIVGEWIYVGGDSAATQFASSQTGFARIGAIGSGYLEFDKVTWSTPAADAGTGKTIQIFFGNVVRNENATNLIVRTSYNLERTLGVGNAGALTQAEYLEGAVANQMTINVPQEDKVTIDFDFVALAHTSKDSSVGPKSGNRPSLADAAAFDTAASTPRIRISLVDKTTSTVTPLYAYGTDIKVTVNNNASVNKALGVLGGFDVSVGNFEVSGSMAVYFADVSSFDAIRQLKDVTLDFAVVESNAGFMFDIPLCTLGDGRNDVSADQPVNANLDIQAVQNSNGYTMLVNQFPYLPTAAG